MKLRASGPAVAIALVLALAIGVSSASALAPSVTVENAGGVSYTSALAKGTVDPQGEETFCHFEYISQGQLDENLANGFAEFEFAGQAPCNVEPLTGTGGQPVEAQLVELSPATVYHLRLVASNEDGGGEAVAAATFETEAVGPASASINPVTTFTGTTAHFSGTVHPEAPAGNPSAFDVSWSFVCDPECPGLSGGMIPADSASHTVEVDATGLEPNTDYKVELTATNAGGSKSAGPQSFHTSVVSPGAETMAAFAIQGGTEALVGGRVNPKNSATTYLIEYGISTGYGKNTATASAGSGAVGSILSQKIGGLMPSTVYHFRVVAKNASGQTTSGADMNFETAPAGPAVDSCANSTLRSENNSTALPDCRAYEQVSPVDKNGFDAGANGNLAQGRYVASEDGSAVAYESFGAFGDIQSGSFISTYIARRGDGGWMSHGLTPPQQPAQNPGIPAFQWYSPDLRYGMFMNTPPNASLAPGDDPGRSNFYLRDTVTGTYRTLAVLPTPNNPEVGGGTLDGRRMFFASRAALTPDAIDLTEGSNLYEWDDGQLKLASIRPNGEPSPSGASFADNHGRNLYQVSKDGTRMIFKDYEDHQIYLREDGQHTIKVSVSQRATLDPGDLGLVTFEGSSADGSKIFFSDNLALTEDAQLATGGGPKLYRYNVDTNTVIDLTANPLPGEIEQIERVAAVSSDGEYVYFRSPTRFHPGEHESGGSALYLWHNGTITFIASDGETGYGDTSTWAISTSYRISPDGRRLSFSTPNRLTSYDNTDSVPAKDGSPRHDSEVYIYDADVDRLTCVSCNPNGKSPAGAPDDGPAANSDVPPPGDNKLNNLQPGVGDDGHIFFNSRDALVPQDVDGKRDVYEWENGRVHLISSGSDGSDSFLASSGVDGDDAFFVTRERLVDADQDNSQDIYDARVGGGFPKATEANPCEGLEGCHGLAGKAPPFVDPASGTFSSPLKPPRSSAQRLRKALEACKHRPTKARAKCRAAAKKRYGKASKRRIH